MMQSYHLSAGYQTPSLHSIHGMALMGRGGCPHPVLGNQPNTIIPVRRRQQMTTGAGLRHGLASMERGEYPRLDNGNQLDTIIPSRRRQGRNIGAGLRHGRRVQLTISMTRGRHERRKEIKRGISIIGMRLSPVNRAHSRGPRMKRHGRGPKRNE